MIFKILVTFGVFVVSFGMFALGWWLSRILGLIGKKPIDSQFARGVRDVLAVSPSRKPLSFAMLRIAVWAFLINCVFIFVFSAFTVWKN